MHLEVQSGQLCLPLLVLLVVVVCVETRGVVLLEVRQELLVPSLEILLQVLVVVSFAILKEPTATLPFQELVHTLARPVVMLVLSVAKTEHGKLEGRERTVGTLVLQPMVELHGVIRRITLTICSHQEDMVPTFREEEKSEKKETRKREARTLIVQKGTGIEVFQVNYLRVEAYITVKFIYTHI